MTGTMQSTAPTDLPARTPGWYWVRCVTVHGHMGAWEIALLHDGWWAVMGYDELIAVGLEGEVFAVIGPRAYPPGAAPT